MGYNLAKKKMKKKALLIIAAVSLFAMTILSSCTAADISAFQGGFRDGWNSTAPAEYRY
jgi:hypothetical protein